MTFVDILISTVTGEVIGPAAIGDPVVGGVGPDLRFGPVDDPAVAIELAEAETEAEAEAEAEAAAQLKTEQERLCRGVPIALKHLLCAPSFLMRLIAKRLHVQIPILAS